MNGIPDQRRRVIIGAASLIALAGLLYGGWAWWHSRSHVSTDDAYVEGAVAVVSSKVMGNIAELLVQDNQHVKAGDLLVRVDSRDFRAKRDQAAAAASARAAMESTGRRQVQAERAVQQTEAELSSKVLGIQQAKQRVAELKGSLARAESQRHQVPMKEADIIRAEAALAQARADLGFAELQLQYTEVRAPVEGIVSSRTVELGQVAQMGQPLLAIVPLHEVWVLANFKETQLARIRPGMRAEISVDTFPDRVFRGTVDSLSAGTGARFSLLPPENATGNWVKVVQRLPAKTRLDADQLGNRHTQRAGRPARA